MSTEACIEHPQGTTWQRASVGQGKLTHILVQKGPWVPKALLRVLFPFSPKDVCHTSACEVPRLSLPGLVVRQHAVFCLYMAVWNQIDVRRLYLAHWRLDL